MISSDLSGASKPIPDAQHSPDQKLARYKNMVQVMQDESSSGIDHKTDVAGLELLLSEVKEAIDKSKAKLRAQEIQDVYEKKCREDSIPVTKRITSSKLMNGEAHTGPGRGQDVSEGLVVEFMNMEDVSHWTFIMYYEYTCRPQWDRELNQAYSSLEPTSAPGLNIRLHDLPYRGYRKRRRCEENEENEEKEDEKKAAAMKSQADYAVFLEAIREKSGFLADEDPDEDKDYFQTCIQNSR